MSPASQFHLLASIAALCFATCADGASPNLSDQPLPEHAAVSRAASVMTASARPPRRLTSSSRTEKASATHVSASERALDYVSRGSFALQVGQTAEAIAAFEYALKLAPGFTDAWGKLAYLYLKNGDSAKAVEAFKKAKLLGDANGGMTTRNAVGVLLFP